MRPLRLDAQQSVIPPDTAPRFHITFDTLSGTLSREGYSSARWRQLPALLLVSA